MADRYEYAVADRWSQLREAIQQTGYYPNVVTEGIVDALAGESVEAYVLHHEPTFDREEVRRHLTVLAMTESRLVLTHTDEHSPDDLLPEPYTSTTTEAVPLGSVSSVVTTRMVATSPTEPGGNGTTREAVITIGWGSVSRVELEPAQCSDPTCEADHGYSGNVTSDDFTLRMSATADGIEAVEQLLDFGRRLSAATAGA
ncbi:MAG TPA: DUF5998 family protein [Nocardioidaceae bacterium]|nr:DUF5998 family protein [Nocardioidaceae bacterium]